MIEGINLLISIFIGCIVFIYYTNALFKPRTKYLYANISIYDNYYNDDDITCVRTGYSIY